jgi:hypothetical protein
MIWAHVFLAQIWGSAAPAGWQSNIQVIHNVEYRFNDCLVMARAYHVFSISHVKAGVDEECLEDAADVISGDLICSDTSPTWFRFPLLNENVALPDWKLERHSSIPNALQCLRG